MTRTAVVAWLALACICDGVGCGDGSTTDTGDGTFDAPTDVDDDSAVLDDAPVPPDDGAADADADADGDADADADGDADADADDSGPPGCDLTIALSTSAGPPTPTGVVIAAGSEPLLCWIAPTGATLPDADGWDLWIQRDDVPGGPPESAEWVIVRGIPPAERSIRYGDCPPSAMACWPAQTLRAGGHSFAIWDGTRVGGLNGSVAFTVE